MAAQQLFNRESGLLNVDTSSSFREQIRKVLEPLIPPSAPVAVFDFPNHPNVGDSAIWLGQDAYLQQNASPIVHVDDCYVVNHGFPQFAPHVIVLINGGGNLGDLYHRHQRLREELVSFYQRNRVIQFPQSIFFQEEDNQQKCRAVLNKHKDFHLLVRDKVSLEQAGKLHDGPVYLCPDMALFLPSLPRSSSVSRTVVGLLRHDKEGVSGVPPASPDLYVCDWLEEHRALKTNVDRLSRIDRKIFNRSSPVRYLGYRLAASRRVRRGCTILSSGKVVITDRLHAHILCTMLKVPHVVLDNNYNKIRNFRQAWNTGAGICEGATSIEEALTKARAISDISPLLG